MERRLQELSEKVISLEQERDQLLRAVDSATGDSEVECLVILPPRHSVDSRCPLEAVTK